MPNSLLQQLFVISFISTIICLTIIAHAYNQCPDDQKALLLELKNELIFNSSISTKLVQWNQSDDCCKWEGVGCDVAGHVVSLQLDSEGISSGIENSSSLVSLVYLEKLNLAQNSLNGTIPTLNLSNLVELDLSSNQLKGSISYSFFINLERLEVISLSYNLFNGSFELENTQSLHNPSFMNSNWFIFPQLKELSLSSCNLHTIPDFLKQSNLNFLDLSNNQITGEIPSWIWEIGNGGLYHLNLSYNLLLDLQKPYHIPSFLAELDLRSNQLTGELPLLPRGASYVDFSDNKFEKPIPLSFVSFNFNLIFLSIANNSISGSIPTCICSAESIQVLDFSLNILSGIIPPCIGERMHSLQMLNLRMNNLSGDIPDGFPANCGLRILDLNSNNLGGNFPKSLQHCTSLWFVNVGGNKIGGSFPCMLPSRLRVLVLHSNRFNGEMKCGESWLNLQIMDISCNNFSGNLHHISFSSLKTMMQHDYAHTKHGIFGINVVRPDFNYLTQVDLTFRGSRVEFNRRAAILRLLDLSCNNFQGEIPIEIGDLSYLHFLNLSNNALTGKIPGSLGDMENLELLDLSVNQLTEAIPPELARLKFLSFLSLSDNKLVGKIPTSVQLQSMDTSAFKGNAGLCGSPLDIRCSDKNSTKHGNMQPRGKPEMEWYYMFIFLFASLYFQV